MGELEKSGKEDGRGAEDVRREVEMEMEPEMGWRRSSPERRERKFSSRMGGGRNAEVRGVNGNAGRGGGDSAEEDGKMAGVAGG